MSAFDIHVTNRSHATNQQPESGFPVGFRQKVVEEFKSLRAAAVFFGCWTGMLVTIKHLILAEYDIAFGSISTVLMGVLILSKVVVVLEHVPLAKHTRGQPAWVDVSVRTLLYSLGVFIVLLVEKAFEARHEYGGFGAALAGIFDHADMPHVWANTTGLFGALLVYNIVSVIRMYSPDRSLMKLLLLPVPDDAATRQPEPPVK